MCCHNRIAKLEYESRALTIKIWKLEWYMKVNDMKKEIKAMMNKHHDNPDSVSAQDWDDMARGSEKKIAFLFQKKFPKDTWPGGVPYLNMIAREKWEIEQEKRDLAKRAAKAKALIEAIDSEGEVLMLARAERQSKSKWQKLNELHAKVGRDELSVSLIGWEEASEGSLEVLERHPALGAYIKRAREREAGEKTEDSEDIVFGGEDEAHGDGKAHDD
jgi:hypothetical protein